MVSKYLENGYDGLETSKRTSKRQWNSIPEEQKDLVVEIALEHTELSSRELAHKITDEQGVFISESSVYRILKQRDLIRTKSFYFQQQMNLKTRPNSCIKCGKQILLISKLSVGVGTI
jgi:transposase